MPSVHTPLAAMQGALVLRVPTLWSFSCVHPLCLAIPVPRDSVCGDTGHSVDNSVQYCVSLPVNEFIKFKMWYSLGAALRNTDIKKREPLKEEWHLKKNHHHPSGSSGSATTAAVSPLPPLRQCHHLPLL